MARKSPGRVSTHKRPIAPSLGSQRLMLWRLDSGATRNDAALQLGITPKYYGRIEDGRQLPGFDYLLKITKRTGIDALDWERPIDGDLTRRIARIEGTRRAAA